MDPLTRDQLRADLAEMELRLRIFLTNELAKKADRQAVEALQAAVLLLQETAVLKTGPLMADLARIHQVVEEGMAGTMNAAQERMLNEWLEKQLTKGDVKRWSVAQRWAAVGVGALAVGSFALNMLNLIITGTP